MTKTRNRNRGGQRPTSIDQGVTELERLARSDRGAARERVTRTTEEAEEEALDGQRAVYDRIVGKKTAKAPARERASQRDERAHLDDDEEDEPEELDDLDEDDDEEADDGDLDDDGEASAGAVPPEKLDAALNALRRANAPAWVFAEPPERQLELAESFASHQANADRLITAKDDTIRALSGKTGRGTQASAESESPGEETPGEDLETAAEGLATALGLSADPEAKKALVTFGKLARGRDSRGDKDRLERLESDLEQILLTNAVRDLGTEFPRLQTDRSVRKAFEERVGGLARSGLYTRETMGKLFRDAADDTYREYRIAKASKEDLRGDARSDSRARARKGSAPVTQARADRRSKAPREGTEDHDRAVFDRVMRKSRTRLAGRR